MKNKTTRAKTLKDRFHRLGRFLGSNAFWWLTSLSLVWRGGW